MPQFAAALTEWRWLVTPCKVQRTFDFIRRPVPYCRPGFPGVTAGVLRRGAQACKDIVLRGERLSTPIAVGREVAERRLSHQPRGLLRVRASVIAALLSAPLIAIADSAEGTSGIVLEAKTLSLSASPGKSEVAGMVSFRNTGKLPVRMTKADASCPCLEATCSDVEIAAGASSEIIILIHLESLADTRAKTVLAQFVSSDGGVFRQSFKVDVKLPELPAVSPTEIVWKDGLGTTEHEIVIQLSKRADFKIRDWNCSHPGVVVSPCKGGPEGELRYKVRMSTTDTHPATNGNIVFNTTSRIPLYQKVRVPFRISRFPGDVPSPDNR